MPMIRVDMFAGRTQDQKRAIAKALTEAFCSATGNKPESVQIILTDIEKSDWATAGVFAADKG
ncbi:4-oxalocrotonate tautomerase [Rhodovarius crocodyli]|uniref:4-oxalocrotonate tautomerase n=1 Tax=Rhodovarius crocodyli TaxID=1979269 RepID=A0A437M3F8_9PROT|nr:2-hydroxymuconate tautomerase [Rhodovarius crocodyli]RVT92241.1 4-oxalocrotonate tautomerase [Rhodovarius crocodyli]